MQEKLVLAVCERLEQQYGSARHGNPTQPLDDLVFIILSNRTTASAARSAFERLAQKYPFWLGFPRVVTDELLEILRPIGLAHKRALQLVGVFTRVRADFGSETLEGLRELVTEDAHKYLTSLPGVSDKVAKCVLMYTLERDVLPVDVHVYRITSRLGWHKRKRADQCHHDLETIVPEGLRYGFHSNCVSHGRNVCNGSPACDQCCIRDFCAHGSA
jgi:endonuclease-3